VSAVEAVRRFYKSVRVDEIAGDGGFTVLLDTRALKTRAGAAFHAPTRALAEACAAEWDAQGDYIDFASMPVTRLTFEAIDLTPERREGYVSFISGYGETDLCCHRAASPAEPTAREAAVRQPLVDWAAAELGVVLPVVTGVQAAPRNEDAISRLRTHAAKFSDFYLVALSQATKLAGSVLIGLALIHRRLDGQQAYEAAALDDLWSLERWGEDAEARARLDRQRDDFSAIARFLDALGRP
jgi:chaperone required for assembly of F1-ATPase